jgi:magnesium transporter
VRERIRKAQGQIRTQGTDWLMYSMIDAVVDGYFPVLEKLGEALEQLEDDILEKFDRSTPARILELKREILGVRRGIWPAREAINTLIRNDNPQITDHTKVYLRDCYDHVVRIIDLVETQREMCSDLMDLYLSSASNRMNEVMKVLTMITLLFMPPTLVAGIYGMNFDTNVSRWNMPELDWHYGYFFALALMAGSMIIVYGLVQWRGWLQDDFPAKADPNNANNPNPNQI